MQPKRMTKDDVPESAGVFKPIGHVVIGFSRVGDLRAARDTLSRAGYAEQDFVSYTPEEMKAQSERQIEQAGVLASFGHEINLVQLYRELSEQGHHWLVVFAPEDDQAAQVADVARRSNAKLAQKYNPLVIEELL